MPTLPLENLIAMVILWRIAERRRGQLIGEGWEEWKINACIWTGKLLTAIVIVAAAWFIATSLFSFRPEQLWGITVLTLVMLIAFACRARSR